MSCITSISTSILFNRGTLESFHPSRGIRQGDALSPYLLIICMDFLSQLIEEKCSDKLWTPVKSSKSGPAFSHLMFADDVVFFAKANQVNCSAIRDVLDFFCGKSGQSVSKAKTRVFFSPNVDSDTRESLYDILRFQSTPSLGKYLGISIKHQRASSQDLNFVVDRVKQKLARWKENLLSVAGRVVLIQSSLSTVPAYVMQCAQLPRKVLEGIDRVNQNFLWGSTEMPKKMHWIGWEKVTKPKKQGGV